MNTNHKSDFRKSCIKRLKYVALFSKYSKNKRVIKKLKSIIRISGAKNILLYIPLEMEVDITLLITELRKEKKIVYVPFMEDDSFKIVKYRLPLHKKKFNIKEPTNSFFKTK